jgi:hypothetical protein
MAETSCPKTGIPPIQPDAARGRDESMRSDRDAFPCALDDRPMSAWNVHRIMRAKGRSLLELGFGHGYSSPIFALPFPEVYGH